MHDPVVAADGNSYERSAIEAWFSSGEPTSPLTNEPLPHAALIPNNSLKKVIGDLVEVVPQGELEKQYLQRKNSEFTSASPDECEVPEGDCELTVDSSVDFASFACASNGLLYTKGEDNKSPPTWTGLAFSPPVSFGSGTIREYGGDFSWVGAPYRMVVRKGFSPLQMLNSLSNHLLALEHMVFTNDGGFQRPGETTSLFPQQGVNLRWRWDADKSRVIIDFFDKQGPMKWRWDELKLCSELRFPSTVPDFECIGHVGRFTFDYVFRSTAAEEEVPQRSQSGLSQVVRSFTATSSFFGGSQLLGTGLHPAQETQNGSQQTSQSNATLQIGDLCTAAASGLMRKGQDVGSPSIEEFSKGTSFRVVEFGTQPGRIKVQVIKEGWRAYQGSTDDEEGWINSATQQGDPLLINQGTMINQEAPGASEKVERLEDWLPS